jgi:hypothetical protein
LYLETFSMAPHRPKDIRISRLTTRPIAASLPLAGRAGRAVAQRTEGEALIADIAKRRARIEEDFYEIGVALAKLARPATLAALGYERFGDLLAARGIMSRVQAVKLITVVEAYPRKLALKLGVEKGYALVRYTATTEAPDVARRLAAANVPIAGKRLHRLTVKELRDETKRLQAGPPPPEEDAKAARREARRLQKALRAKGAPSAKVRAYRDDAEWRLRVELDVADGAAAGG